MSFSDPATLAFLGIMASLVGGETQAVRATGIPGRWLPLVAGACGCIDAVLASLTPDNPLTGVGIAGALLAGLIVGFGAAGIVTVATHWGTGSTASPPRPI